MKPLYLLILFILLSCSTSTSVQEDPADVLITGGTIVTMEADQQKVEAIAVTDGKITWLGSLKESAAYKGDSTKMVDLKNNTLFPGLIEQHLHPTLGALTLSIAVIAPEDWELPSKTWKAAKNGADYLQKLQAAVDNYKEEGPFFSWGYHQYFHGDLDRTILDGISKTIPIIIWHRSCHEFYMNTAAIQKYGLTRSYGNGHCRTNQLV